MDEMRQLVIGAVVLAAGCMGNVLPDQKVYVDPSIPTEAVVQAMAAWEAIGARYELVATRDGATVAIKPGAETDCLAGTDGKLWVGTTVTNSGDTTIYIRMACYSDYSPATTIAHELGHVLTLGHIEGRPALMAGFYDDRVEPALTDADREAFAGIWGHP